MKTAMQELIEYMKDGSKYLEGSTSDWLIGQKASLDVVIEKAKELLDKEKEQIKRANDDGWADGRREKFNEEKFFKDSEEYYQKTYL